MGFFSFILFLLIALLVLIIIGSVQEFALWCVTKKSHEFIVMIIPAMLSVILFAATTVGTYFVLRLFNINAINIIYSMIMKWEYSFNSYIYIIISYILCFILFILLQAFCLNLSNIDYKKIYNFFKTKLFKKENVRSLNTAKNEQTETSLIEIPNNPKIGFFYTFSASLFAFSICFFSTLLLMYIGTLIGGSYIL